MRYLNIRRKTVEERDYIYLNNLEHYMKFDKPSEEILTWFEEHAPEGLNITKRKMFGYPCRFFNNNMFMGLFQSQVFLRLSKEDKQKFLTIKDAHQFEPMPGRIMKEYVILPSDLLNNDEQVQYWLSRSLAYMATLPPK